METNHTYFVDEIILEILARLPIKSLIRTKCVCKLWYNLASHKSFTQLYNHLSLKNAMLLLQVTDSSTDSTSIVFVNGSLHWMTQSFAYILVLDLSLDSWRRILLPEEMGCGNGSGNRVYLLEFDGKLSVIQISSVWMNIWVLQDYGKGKWDLIDRVSLRCIRGMVPGIFPISQGGDYVFLAGHKQVLVYQRKTRSWKEMYSVKNNSTMPLWFSAHSFRGTIFSCR
uniref:Putative F-box domain-containing protein n=1 Tax=Helianthus annuus TaxID=4232 RepID=A0A251TFM1_HELAN